MKPRVLSRVGTIVLRPSVRQWLCDQWPVLTVNVAAYALLWMSSYPKALLLLPLMVSLHLIYQLVFMRNMKFTFSEELLMYEYGVFNKRVEYLELYRVVDFHERINVIQNLFGLKTVVLHSGDRSTPTLIIPGIDRHYPLVAIVRQRVESGKRSKGIYEITNR